MSDESKRRTRQFACLFLTFAAITVILIVLLAQARRESQICFVVDALRERVPHTTPHPYEQHSHPPFAVGTLCFDEQQQLVEWRLQETFQFAYGLHMADMRLHGPLAVAPDSDPATLNEAGPRAPHVAQVVVPMGLRRDSKLRLAGSSIIEMNTLLDAATRPDRYYVALYATNREQTAQIEVGRSALLRSRSK